MVGTSKAVKGRKSYSLSSKHWKNLPRDSKGRWAKRRKKKSPSSSSKKPAAPPSHSKTIKQLANVVTPQKNHLCPRCGGDMKKFRIRCGPERLVSVQKCKICNYWIPLAEQPKPNPVKA
ncbi:MAG: hypothetical protein ACTSVZ_05195 [Promethearchaeota archaeon]